MTWIAEAITENAFDILREVSLLYGGCLEEEPAGMPHEEIMKQAELTVELLPHALLEGNETPILDRWEAIGRNYAGLNIAMAEIPNTPDIVKRAAWNVLEKDVEQGKVKLSELVSSMMKVESILSNCRFAMMRSYLDSRDVKVAARTARMESLYALTEVLSTERDSNNIYRSIVDNVVEITEVDRCALLALSEGGGLKPVACNVEGAIEVLERSLRSELDSISTLMHLGGPLILRKGSSQPEIEKFMEEYITSDALLVPLKSGESFMGLLILDRESNEGFSDQQIDMAVAVANQAAVAADKSDLISKVENRLKHMAALGLVARTSGSRLDPSELLGNFLELAVALLRADRGAIMLVEEMLGELKVSASFGELGWGDGEGTMRRVAEWVIEHGEPVVLKRGKSDPRFEDLETGVEASITAPLMVRDKAIGVISIATDKSGEKFGKDDEELFGNFASQVAVSIENTQLYDRLQDTYLGAIASLAAAIEARDPYTVGHSARVTKFAVAIAEEMGLPPEEIEELRLAGLLHDLGKIGVPDSILNKPGRLSDEEFSAIKMHPTLSTRIIEPLPHLGKIIPIIYHHHEWYDGKGYVDGKSGTEIPLGARIIAVADSFEAMTSDRPYRKALSREEAIAELHRNAGSQFDPEVVGFFLKLLEESAPSE